MSFFFFLGKKIYDNYNYFYCYLLIIIRSVIIFCIFRLEHSQIASSSVCFRTPLHEAISQKHLNICTTLVTAGANINLTNGRGQTVKELAIEVGLTEKQFEDCLGLLFFETFSILSFSSYYHHWPYPARL